MIEFNSTLTLLKLFSGKDIEVNQTHANGGGCSRVKLLGPISKL